MRSQRPERARRRAPWLALPCLALIAVGACSTSAPPAADAAGSSQPVGLTLISVGPTTVRAVDHAGIAWQCDAPVIFAIVRNLPDGTRQVLARGHVASGEVAQASVSGADLAAGANTLALTAADGIRPPAEVTLSLIRDDAAPPPPDGGTGTGPGCHGHSCDPQHNPAGDGGVSLDGGAVPDQAVGPGDAVGGADGGSPDAAMSSDGPGDDTAGGADAAVDGGSPPDAAAPPDTAADAVAVDPAAPFISAITPGHGSSAGGTQVQLLGMRFQGGVRVLFGSSAGTSVRRHGSSRLDVVTPAGIAGPVTVTVENSDGRSHSVTDGFTYDP
jgi:hypothetical protein